MKAKNEWVWQNDEDDPSSVLFYETSAKVKFRICAINFSNFQIIFLSFIFFNLN